MKGRNITFDRLYTDLKLVLRLLEEKDITCIGTWQLSRKGFPKELKEFKTREAPSTEHFYQVCFENCFVQHQKIVQYAASKLYFVSIKN